MGCCGAKLRPKKSPSTSKTKLPYLNDGKCPRCGAQVVVKKSVSPTGGSVPFYKCVRGHVLS